jgi:hypothetical protein
MPVARVYKVVNSKNNDIYIGSTKTSLGLRWTYHKSDMKKGKFNIKLHQLMKEIGVEYFGIVLLEEFEYNNKEEVYEKEQEYINLLKPSLNTNRAYGFYCEHNKIKSRCKECGSKKAFCIHGVLKWNCFECVGSQTCPHKRMKKNCFDCKGTCSCPHGHHNKCNCKICYGFHCEQCNYTAGGKNNFKVHLKSKTHWNNLVKEFMSIEY